jgi:NTP pyrophosphatase (non-canonical NTP hydrolase)
MFNTERCYIYNKAYWNMFQNKDPKSGWIPSSSNGTYAVQEPDKDKYYFGLIRQWAQDKGIYDKGDTKTQYIKLAEEFGELGKALLQDDQPEVVDAIGDMVVVLTNLAHQRGVTIESCIKSAYDVISKRTGKMINGTFVKDN